MRNRHTLFGIYGFFVVSVFTAHICLAAQKASAVPTVEVEYQQMVSDPELHLSTTTYTFLMYALLRARPEAIEKVFKEFPDVFIQDCKTALMVKEASSAYPLARQVLGHCGSHVKDGSIRMSDCLGNVTMTKWCLDQGADPNILDYWGVDLVWIVATQGYVDDARKIELLKVLAEGGLNFKPGHNPHQAYYPLATWLSARMGDLESAKFFIEKAGEDPYSLTEYNPYEAALKNNHTEVAAFIKAAIISKHGKGSFKKESVEKICKGCRLEIQYCPGEKISTFKLLDRAGKVLVEETGLPDCFVEPDENYYITDYQVQNQKLVVQDDYHGMCGPAQCRATRIWAWKNGQMELQKTPE